MKTYTWGDMQDQSERKPVGLEPDPVIETYKRDVDRTLLRENLKLTTAQRIKKMEAAARFAESVRRSRNKADAV